MAWGGAGQREKFPVEINLPLAESQPISRLAPPGRLEHQ